MWEDLRRTFTSVKKTPEVSSEPLDFRELPEVEGRYTMHIEGETMFGRQHIVKLLTVGQPLRLSPEPDNPHDENAIAIETLKGERIGYLSRKNARWVSRVIDEGNDLSARVACLFYGDADGNGVEVQVHIDGVPPR